MITFAELAAKTPSEIKSVIADIPKIKALAAKVKASPIEAIAEKIYPGLPAIEDAALADLDVFSSASSEIEATLSILFPQPAA